MLLLDTSCPTGLVAVAQGETILAKNYLHETRRHSELLSDIVEETFEKAKCTYKDLDLVVVTRGPGSFIGVRIAIAYAKGLCMAMNIPLVSVGTLAAFAHEPSLSDGKIIALLDARRNEFYVQEFEKTEHDIKSLGGPFLYPVGEMAEYCKAFLGVVGFPIPESVPASKAFALDKGPTAEGMLAAFLSDQADRPVVDETLTLVPDYVRDPDAKPMPS